MFNSIQSHAVKHILGVNSNDKPKSVPSDINIGQAFHQFTKEIYTEDGSLINKSFEVLGDDWRALADKKNKTDEEYAKLDNEYKTAFKNLGKSYTQYIDKHFGNGDGKLEKAEYEAFESEEIPPEYKLDAGVMQEVKQMQENAFNRLNLNKDKYIDEEEMTSYLYVLDYATEPGKAKGLNGKISSYDIDTNSGQLGAKGERFLDGQLKVAYKRLFNKDAAE